jgi:hypothetical protein
VEKKRLKIEKNGHPSLRRPRFLKNHRAKEQASIIDVSEYFDYMRVADTIDFQKLEDRDITDKLPQMLLATTKVTRMQSQIFYFYKGKI